MLDREEQLIRATGKPVQLLRRQYTGPRCPCYSLNRGRSKKRCDMCFGTGFVPGYIPYINDSDPLGRIFVRFEPFAEQVAQKEEGMFQEVDINGWVLAHPLVRQRDVIIAYDRTTGNEEFRYEIISVTKNETFQGQTGVQKIQIKRINPTDPLYRYDIFAIPNLADIEILDSELDDEELIGDRFHDRLGNQDDGVFANLLESAFGDGAFSGMFTEGYKLGYVTNFRRALDFKTPLYYPDFNEDGFIDDGFGQVFISSTGKRIKFSTPQNIEDNPGVPPIEVINAEERKNLLNGYVCGAKAGVSDGLNELRARGRLT